MHIYIYTHTYLADCPAALSSAYAYTYVPSRVPSRSLGRQFALSDANLLSRMPIRSFGCPFAFTRDVTRPERRPMPWLGSGWESQEFCGLPSCWFCACASRALSLFQALTTHHTALRAICVCERECIYIDIYKYIYTSSNDNAPHHSPRHLSLSLAVYIYIYFKQ